MRQDLISVFQEVRSKFKDLFDYSLDLVYIHDLKGNFVDANEIALSTLGFGRDEISNIAFPKLIDNDQLGKAFRVLKEILEEGKQKEPSEYKLKDRYGNTIYLETYGIPLKRDDKIFGILGIAKDITVKKTAELKLKRTTKALEELNIILEKKIDLKTQNLKKSIQQLKNSEEKYRNLIKTSTMGFLEINLEKGEIEYINPKLLEILGYERKDFEDDQLIYKIIHPLDFKELSMSREPKDIEFRIISKNKKVKWVSGTRLYQFDLLQKPTKLRLWLQDISRIKESEIKLKKSIESTNLILRSLPIGITLIDYDKKIRSINSKALEIIGADSEDEIIGEICHKNICPSNVNFCPTLDLKKEIGFSQKSILTQDGREIPIVKTVTPIILGDDKLLLEAFMDISKLKETEKKLQKSEAKYRGILESIKEGYFEVDLKGNFTFFNDALCQSIGYTREELLNKNYSGLFNKKTQKKVFTTYNDLYQEGNGTKLFDYQILRKDGKNMYHESSVYLKYDAKGEIIGFKGLVRDVTERKKAEALRNKFSQELEKEVKQRTEELKNSLEQQKIYLDKILKASHFKSEFMATMSHELRTPLNAIIGFTDLLLEEFYGNLNKEQLEFIKDIEESSKHLLDMISNILDISKIETGKVSLEIEEVQIYNIIQQVISSLNPLYSEKDIKFNVKGLKKNQIISIDRVKFKQIVFNLISNAIKFTEEGTIEFEFLDKNGNWEFKVKDTGIGIAKKDFKKIFKEFKRVRSTYIDSKPGSGLGLALTKRLVNLHGGDINFTSELGKGTTFAFFIPKNFKTSNKIGNVREYLSTL